jgi:hypothetical protein
MTKTNEIGFRLICVLFQLSIGAWPIAADKYVAFGASNSLVTYRRVLSCLPLAQCPTANAGIPERH